MPVGSEITLEAVLEFVKETRGFDFTGYKRSTVERRIAKRMAEVGADRYEDYLDYLQLHQEEFAQLFNTILINVTGFFRDPRAWDYLAGEVVPQLVESRASSSPIRIWCAGCASGEEAFTIAMVFARVLGDDGFRERVKIYATDIDEEALDQARHGAYLPRQIEDVPPDALERFFERTDQRYVFRKDLRRCVIFGRNDLVQDAPISHIDLLVCRNVLMYFTVETQAQILRRFHFALDNEGVLLLGKSEMLITHTSLFTPVDLKRRLFRKVMRPSLRERVRALALDPVDGASQSVADNLREAAFDVGRSAQLVLDAAGALVMANSAARNLFGLRVTDLGRPIQDLELSYRPVELRGHLDAVASDLRGIDLKSVRWRVAEQERVFDVRLAPLLGEGVLLGTSIAYEDTTESGELQKQLAASKRELEGAYEELQSTVEELETTNEELQSTNEELETTNEELQSTNEELETMNEELHSSNEELETMNEELRHRTRELHQINSFLESIFSTTGIGVAVIDDSQRVQIWNGNARELWGIAPEEAEGEHLMALDFGLPLEDLRGDLKAALGGEIHRAQRIVDATNRRGQPLQCRVTLVPLARVGNDGGAGVVIMMEALSG
ncbi:MAG: PAS domain-containing protein [Solirubrobacterales bacterium]|nr:PAS domain-containing protein [Solirubrobacterales bacterium]MBV9714410.1 PAS domain-containing protein [Solirubrobacterales bacterium]